MLLKKYTQYGPITNGSVRARGSTAILLIIQRCSMVKQMIWQSNHASHTKVYFNEFVANVMRDDIGIVIFDLRGHGGC